MSESTHEQGVGKTGGLPGANADPAAAETPERELQELQAGEVSPPEPGSAGS